MNYANLSQASCYGKEGHTALRAKQIAQEMRRRGRRAMDAYHCVHCLQWHVGGSRPMPDKRRDSGEKT